MTLVTDPRFSLQQTQALFLEENIPRITPACSTTNLWPITDKVFETVFFMVFTFLTG
jgi:hypothetical protein